MRRKQFSQLIYDLRAELGRSVDPATGVSDLPSLKQTLQRNYETIYDSYDWPHLTVTAAVTLNAGQRYYDFPATIDYDKVDDIRLFWNALPVNIDRGISLDDMGIYDSEADQRMDPPLKWDVRYEANKEVMEIWPIPAGAGSSIRFKGKKKFAQLVDDADVCLIDDKVVVLASAVELLPEKSRQAMQAKLAAAQARLVSTKANSKQNTGSVRIGLGGMNKSPQGLVLRVSG